MSKMNSSLGIENILRILSNGEGSVHFSGVGGVGMCSLFCLAQNFGIKVSGSDRASNDALSHLMSLGADIVIGARNELPSATKLLVYTLALDEQDKELFLAKEKKIPTVSRAEFLGALMECYRERIGVCGSHGKSTVTAMLYLIFSKASLSPTVLCGAALPNQKLPFSFGALDYLIYEACEYKDSFLCFSPTASLFLNLELDHVDYFSSVEQLENSFLRAINNSKLAVINYDDDRLLKLSKKATAKIIGYGKHRDADFRYRVVDNRPYGMRFDMYKKTDYLGRIELSMLGEFNISNAAAAATIALALGVSFDNVRDALESFQGIERRLEKIGEYHDRTVYYDYAHHPTEIKESILALRKLSKGAVTVVFGAHTYSRTKVLFSDFVSSLSLADYVILTDIYGAREEKIEGISIELLGEKIGAQLCPRVKEISEKLENTEGIIVIMGAADMTDLKNFLLSE